MQASHMLVAIVGQYLLCFVTTQVVCCACRQHNVKAHGSDCEVALVLGAVTVLWVAVVCHNHQ